MINLDIALFSFFSFFFTFWLLLIFKPNSWFRKFLALLLMHNSTQNEIQYRWFSYILPYSTKLVVMRDRRGIGNRSREFWEDNNICRDGNQPSRRRPDKTMIDQSCKSRMLGCASRQPVHPLRDLTIVFADVGLADLEKDDRGTRPWPICKRQPSFSTVR